MARTNGLLELTAEAFLPEAQHNTNCSCGSLFTSRETLLDVHGLLATVTVRIVTLTCASCGLTLEWSGGEQAILRHSSMTAFTYELHQEFLAGIQQSKDPSVYSFITSHSRKVSQDRERALSVSTYQEALWSLFQALDVNYIDAFTCTVCGTFETAPVLIGDGKALVCQPAGLAEHSLRYPQSGVASFQRSGSQFVDRIFVPDQPTRELLLRRRWKLTSYGLVI